MRKNYESKKRILRAALIAADRAGNTERAQALADKLIKVSYEEQFPHLEEIIPIAPSWQGMCGICIYAGPQSECRPPEGYVFNSDLCYMGIMEYLLANGPNREPERVPERGKHRREERGAVNRERSGEKVRRYTENAELRVGKH